MKKLFTLAILLLTSLSYSAFSLTVNHQDDSVSCYGGHDGSIQINASGSSPYDYKLYDGNPLLPGSNLLASVLNTSLTTVNFSDLYPGIYWIYVEDQIAISITRDTVYQPAQLKAGYISVQTGLTCFAGSDAELKANPYGGTKPYSYTWYKDIGAGYTLMPQTTQVITGVNQAKYRVEVEGANGCPKVSTNIEFIYFFYKDSTPGIPAPITISSVIGTNTCEDADNGTISITASGGKPDLDYAIYNTTSTDSTFQENSPFTGLSAATYRTWVVDNNGCKKQGSNVTINITPKPTANAGPNAETCAGSSYIFPAGAATATNYSSISWTTSGTGSFTSGTTLTPTYNPSAADITAGSVTLTLHAAGNGSCAEATDNMILTITLAPVANAGPNGETCAGSNYIFGAGAATASNYSSLSWTTSGTGSFTNGTTLTPTYTPSAADITAGSVTLT
ncbi:MAG: hypothetical protein JXJ22_10785, partial [Bacteroidales bacterium]|nr:hypothetical protein [Bacteroidales bacterium]